MKEGDAGFSMAKYLRSAAAKNALAGVRVGHIDAKDYQVHVLRRLRVPLPDIGTPDDMYENWVGACIRVVGLERSCVIGEYVRRENRRLGGGVALVEIYARRIRMDPLPAGCCGNTDLLLALEGVVPLKAGDRSLQNAGRRGGKAPDATAPARYKPPAAAAPRLRAVRRRKVLLQSRQFPTPQSPAASILAATTASASRCGSYFSSPGATRCSAGRQSHLPSRRRATRAPISQTG
jgi:hypothetical protein